MVYSFTLHFNVSFEHFWIRPTNSKLCSTAEICVGIICSCIPILKPLFDGHGFRKPHFLFRTTVFVRFSLLSFRQPFKPKQGHSSDRLDSTQGNDHVESKLDDRNKVKSSIDFTKSNEALWMFNISTNVKISLSRHKEINSISSIWGKVHFQAPPWAKTVLNWRWDYKPHIISRLSRIFRRTVSVPSP